MNRQTIEILLPYLIVGGVSLGYITYALRQRRVAGALPFAWMIFLQVLWTVTSAKDLLTAYHSILQRPQFWETAQMVILAGWVLASLVFTWQYTRSIARHARLCAGLAASVTVIVVGLAILPLWPDLFRPVNQYLSEQIVTTSFYGMPLVNWLNFVWLGGLGLVSLFVLLNRFVSPGAISHVRIGLILIGLLTLVAGISAARFHLSVPLYAGDPTPLAVIVSEMIVFFSLFIPRREQLVSVAHANALENTADVMLTLDPTGRIADMNPAALALIAALPGTIENVAQRDLLKKPFQQVFSNWPELRECVQRGDKGPIELVIALQQGQPCCFAVRLTPLHNHKGRLLGQLLVAHDITLRKQLEKNLQTAEALLQQTRDTLQAKEALLLQTEQSLHTVETRLEQTTTILQETETTLHATQAQLQQTSTKLQETETTLHAVEGHLQKTMTTLQHTDQTLSARETELRQTQATLQKSEQARQDAETTLHTRETELRQTQETLQESEQARQVVETSLHAREIELRQTGETLQAKENNVIELQQARQNDATQLQQAREALQASEATCQSLKEALQTAETAVKTTEETQKQAEQAAEQTVQAVPSAPEPPAAAIPPAQDKQPNLPKGKRLSNAQVQKHLADLPPDNLRALKDAAAQLNPFKIARVIEPIWAQDAALADALQAIAQQHNYKQLSDLIEKAQTAS